MNKVTPFLVALIILFFSSSSAQKQSRIDSLISLLKTDKEDTAKVSHLNKLSREYLTAFNYESAMSNAQKAVALGEKLDFKEGIADGYFYIGRVNFQTSKYDEALKIYNVSLKISKASNYENGMANCYFSMGDLYTNRGNRDTALQNYGTALKIRERMKDKQGIADILNNIGVVYTQKGELDTALQSFTLALKGNEETGNKRGIAIARFHLANVYEVKGKFDDALESYLFSLRIFEEMNNKNGVSNILNSIGNIYYKQPNLNNALENALKNYLAAFNIKKEMGDRQGMALVCNNIGVVYRDQENYEKSKEYFSITRKVAEEISDRNNLAFALNGIASVNERTGRYDEALSNYSSALKVLSEMNDKIGIAGVYNNTGVIFTRQNKFKEAESALVKALALNREVGNRSGMKDEYSALADLFYKQKQYNKALDYYKLFAAMKDSMFNEASARRIDEMSAKYETEKKDKEINQLNFEKEKGKARQNMILLSGSVLLLSSVVIALLLFYRRKARHLLQLRLSHEQTLRSRLSPHFTFNALTAIQGYIVADAKAAGQYLAMQSGMMREMLNNSMKESVSLAQELSVLEKYMDIEKIRLANGFDYEIITGEEVDMEEVFVPPLILQPIIENAIWHGMTGRTARGLIRIEIAIKDKALLVAVENRCKGPAQQSSPMREKKGKSHGLNIVRERLALLSKGKKGKASLEMIPIEDGMRVVIHIPL